LGLLAEVLGDKLGSADLLLLRQLQVAVLGQRHGRQRDARDRSSAMPTQPDHTSAAAGAARTSDGQDPNRVEHRGHGPGIGYATGTASSTS
jgi:hypothetical protein